MKNALVTGGKGYLGTYLVQALKNKYNVLTLGRSSSDYNTDLSFEQPTFNEKISLVVHAAGKAHSIPKTKAEINEFYEINTEGTKRLLKGLESNVKDLRTFIMISSVAVYGIDTGMNISEENPLKGDTPYAKSKILAEKEVQSFCKSHNINCVILRLPLISGFNPPGNLGEMINTIEKGFYFRIGKGHARKSMVSANDVANLLPSLYNKKGVYNLTDGVHPSFKEIEDHICKGLGKNIITFPKLIFTILAKIGDILPFFILNSDKLNKITNSLTFSDEKARKEFNWKPSPALKAVVFDKNNKI